MPLKTVWSPVRAPEVRGQDESAYSREASLRALRAFGVTSAVAAGTAPSNLAATEWEFQAGTSTVTTVAGAAAITFPNAFARCVQTIQITATAGALGGIFITNPTLSGFTFNRGDGAGAATTFYWFAVGA